MQAKAVIKFVSRESNKEMISPCRHHCITTMSAAHSANTSDLRKRHIYCNEIEIFGHIKLFVNFVQNLPERASGIAFDIMRVAELSIYIMDPRCPLSIRLKRKRFSAKSITFHQVGEILLRV